MVSTTKLILLVASAIGAVSAVPAAAPSPESSAPGFTGSTVAVSGEIEKRGELSKRAVVQFQVYENINYGGAGLTISVNDNQCFPFTGVWAGWNDRISSARTLTNGWSCYIYDTSNCSGVRGGPITTGNPHANLHTFGWGDRTSSFICI